MRTSPLVAQNRERSISSLSELFSSHLCSTPWPGRSTCSRGVTCRTLVRVSGQGRSIEFSPNGKHLLATGPGYTLIWNIEFDRCSPAEVEAVTSQRSPSGHWPRRPHVAGGRGHRAMGELGSPHQNCRRLSLGCGSIASS